MDALAPGARLGPYEVLGRLGAGGMGEVYEARDTRLGRSVALKVLRPGDDPELLRRLEREARAASALNHPNIVHIYDVGESGAHYVAMEKVDGETLRRRLARGALALPELLDLAAQLGDGLDRAHRAGIVHRDLKPENLMVTPDGLLKILDFGLAKLVAAPLGDVDSRETLSRQGTRAGTLLGTLEYMSPEQASGRTVDHRTDQFSLGAILHEMATGRPAFRRDTPAQVLAAVIERDPEPLRRLRPEVPEALEALVARCLRKDPARRFDRTADLAAELATLAGRSRATSGGRLVPVPSAAPVEVLPPEPARASSYHVQGRRRVETYDEGELDRQIRRGKLSGNELVRRDDEEEWRPLFESQVFRRAVPTLGDPRAAVRQRLLRAMVGHASGFVITGIVMYGTQGHLPFWMGIWGAVLGLQALQTLPQVWPLLRPRREERRPPVVVDPPQLPAPEPPRLAAPAGVPAEIAEEAIRVRALIAQQGGKDAAELLAAVDAIVKLTAELAARQADLEEQTSERERVRLAAAVREARERLERLELDEDRRLFERQLEVVEGREATIAKAVRVLERVKVRRELAEHQLKQLRLDLSRSAASGLDVPELSSRLQFIRDEIDAREELEAPGRRS